MKTGLIVLLFLCTFFIVSAQTPVQKLIDQKFTPTSTILEPFSLKSNVGKTALVDPTVLEEFSVLKLNTAKTANLINTQSTSLELSIPLGDRMVELELIKSLFDPKTTQVYAASERSKYLKLKHGAHYWGRIKGDITSGVALSIYDDEITGTINTDHASYCLVKLKQKSEHIIYQEKNLKDKPSFSCFTDELENFQTSSKSNNQKAANPDNAIGMYIEVDNDIYNDFGSIAATTNYINAVMNQVAILYANENINFGVREMVIWDTTDPYTGPSSGNYLNQFVNRMAQTGFNGDLAHLLGYGGGGGVAYVGVVCMPESQREFSTGYSGITSTFQNVPSYSWTVNVITHEIGHNLGSPHTHDCSWNGNNTAIDGCGFQAGAGGCNGPIPENGGTIMSYCHLTSAGINLNNGFGPQPGNLIRNTVYNADCLVPSNGGPTCTDGIQNGDETGVDCGGSCAVCPSEPSCTDGIQNGNETGVDCGGPDCPECPTDPTCSDVVITITFDNYPEETSWTLSSDGGSILGSGGPYGNQPDGSTINITGCLGEGCYVLTINDTYGDGICCNYGQGSYSITVDGEQVANGGTFTSSVTESFCVEGGEVEPTCNDGIQNGNETDVDCGGSDCAPCPTCNDGILNGNETGVDCGGSDCPACPTCDDGIQNGNETDVDCGGSDCAPCPTCNDGIQNGNETGVDCGGSDCPACPTCDDGIQNGNETDVDCGGPDCAACPTCNDGIQNGNETGVDCGGPDCPACPVDPTCDDGIQNGDETDVDCGGTDCPACPTEECTDVVIDITFDNYPEETSWMITTDNGSTIASGGTYNNRPDGSTLSITECLDEGCYTFSIMDTYGDGICCSYGSGAYQVSVGGQIVASGGSFGSSESTPFCVDGGGVTDPTCTDGIQNGSETDVDCGGSDCEPCPVDPTCDDGIQNGNETGIDCGGSDCAACPSGGCTDVVVTINLDNYPEETSWNIADGSGSIVASGGRYTNQADRSTVTITECLDDGCYTFTILDSYGDGICCSYGSGDYSVTANGIEIASGARFGSSESTGFCVGNASDGLPQTTSNISTTTKVEDITIYPNPANVDIIIDYKLKEADFTKIMIYDLTGSVILETPYAHQSKGAHNSTTQSF